MKHWIRDLQLTTATATRCQGQIDYVIYHFLRTMGWMWLWECDGYAGDAPNRVPDGNMETAGVGSWTAVGTAVLAKVTTPVHSGVQALQVDSVGLNDGVESAPLVTMETATTYHTAIWVLNNTGQSWNVDVDIGTGYVTVGTVPSSPSWQLRHFDFTTAAVGVQKIRVADNLNSQGTIYLSDVLIIKSYFEYNPADSIPQGTDGSTINPNQFSSLSYNFVVGDIGKVICLYDPTNNKNSGAYKITAAAGGVATVDLRSGTAAFVAQSGLSWRMIDLATAPENVGNTNPGQRGAGFGLQSPHTSQWRFFARQAQYGSGDVCMCGVWGAPEDTDFDFSTGTFYRTGPSTQNDKQGAYYLPASTALTWTRMHLLSSGSAFVGGRRFFFMTEDDGSFFTTLTWDPVNNLHDACLVGYLGADPYHPGIEEWALFARWQAQYSSGWQDAIYPDGNTFRMHGKGTVIARLNGLTQDALWGQYGYSNLAASVLSQTNAGPNRWSLWEWLHKPVIMRDPYGLTGFPSERDANVGVYQGRLNRTPLSTFDSDAYIHFRQGYYWEWGGETILP